jgi:hypothetical protein
VNPQSTPARLSQISHRLSYGMFDARTITKVGFSSRLSFLTCPTLYTLLKKSSNAQPFFLISTPLPALRVLSSQWLQLTDPTHRLRSRP